MEYVLNGDDMECVNSDDMEYVLNGDDMEYVLRVCVE